MNEFLKRLELKEIAARYTKRVITALFAGFAFFLIFLILAGFGLAVAYVAFLIVNIGSDHSEKFAVPEWVKPYERWSVGFFILSLISLAGLQAWKDALRYFRYETIEPEENQKAKEDDKLQESRATEEEIEAPDPPLVAEGIGLEALKGSTDPVAARGAASEGEKPATVAVARPQANRRNRRRKKH